MPHRSCRRPKSHKSCPARFRLSSLVACGRHVKGLVKSNVSLQVFERETELFILARVRLNDISADRVSRKTSASPASINTKAIASFRRRQNCPPERSEQGATSAACISAKSLLLTIMDASSVSYVLSTFCFLTDVADGYSVVAAFVSRNTAVVVNRFGAVVGVAFTASVHCCSVVAAAASLILLKEWTLCEFGCCCQVCDMRSPRNVRPVSSQRRLLRHRTSAMSRRYAPQRQAGE